MPGDFRIALGISASPLTRFTTPAGRSKPSMISNTRFWVSGTCSEGLSTNVLPVAMAKGRNQNGTIAGKLNGTIAAHTPTGWRTVSQSTPPGTFSSTRPCPVVGTAGAPSTPSPPLDRRHRAPAGERLARGADRVIQILWGGQRDPRQPSLGGGVEHVEGP